ncbi:MAG: PTS sugar transporter subunit IIA [Lachnospiraceae bacterium]|nr:PTS sugar transporter subunit IIA [Lachnospiraceae bacterium]
MQVKHLGLLKFMFENDNWLTARVLSSELSLSVRTIKSYVHELNDEFPGIIVSSPHGYKLEPKIASLALKDNKVNIPQTSRERCAYIINRIIKSEQNSTLLKTYDLCEELFIAPTTLRSVFPRIRKLLENFDLSLEIKSENISIVGSERNKRRIISHLIYNEANENFVDLDTIQNAFPDIDIQSIKDAILTVLSQNQYFINDYSLISLVLHLTIAITRIQNDRSAPTLDSHAHSEIKEHEYRISNELISILEQRFGVLFSAEEVDEITLLLISRSTSLDYQSITIETLKEHVTPACLNIVNKFVKEINSFLDLNLKDPDFYVRFCLHINNLLFRAKNQTFNRNPLGTSIKATCPLIYEHAVLCSEIIYKETGLSINDDEIAYIAFHLGSAFETQRVLSSKLQTIILSPTYYAMDSRLFDTIRDRFSSEIVVTNIVQSEDSLDTNTKVDFIISTVPLNKPHEAPTVVVAPFLSENNTKSISHKIEEIKHLKEKKRFEHNFKKIFKPELFEYGDDFSSKDDAISYLTDKLCSLGYVDETFADQIHAREEMSSTGFDNFAIPHSLQMDAKKTGMYFYISKSKISWDESNVNLIIMLCFRKDERYIFNEIFDSLTMILTEPAIINEIIKIKTYDKLMEFICEQIR